MIDLSLYGFERYAQADIGAAEERLLPARVTAVHRERYEIVCARGEVFAKLKASVYYGEFSDEEYPTVGDFVLVRHNPGGDCIICRTLERGTFFSRRNPTPGAHGEQAVAANFDYVFIMMSLNRDFNVRRLERYLTAAWQSGAQPVVILTKVDLAGSRVEWEALADEARAAAIGADVCAVSSVTGYGLDGLAAYLAPGRTAVFLGSSGVGKSSLVNALTGSERMAVKEIREDDAHGRHTTTHRQLIMLPSGAMLIDTPGMRELGMWDVSVGLGESFGDIESQLDRCRFADCRHENEPGCAVRAAIESGVITAERWESYRKLRKEARYTDDRLAFMRERQKWHKSLAKFTRQRKDAKDGG